MHRLDHRDPRETEHKIGSESARSAANSEQPDPSAPIEGPPQKERLPWLQLTRRSIRGDGGSREKADGLAFTWARACSGGAAVRQREGLEGVKNRN